jgi:iron complex outermembrane receptor protein
VGGARGSSFGAALFGNGTAQLNGRKTVFRANIQNVTGASYWSSVASFGTFFLGAPRTYLLSMTVDM